MSMNVMISQGICLGIMVLLFGYVLYKYPLKPTVKKMVYAAFFILLSVVLNAVSLMVPFFGVPSVKISLAGIPLLLAGALLTPSWAYLVGFITDVIGLLITPTSFPFLGFTLSHILTATLPSLYFQKSKHFNVALVEKFVYILLVLISTIASFYVWQLDSVSISGSDFMVGTTLKIGITLFLTIIAGIMIYIIYMLKRRMKESLVLDFANWMIIVILMEVLISMILTPIWLDVMYGIPWFISTFIRIVKACIMIPIDIIIGFSLLRILKQQIKIKD